ncbi:hypothetical protein SNEBB_009786 [Seison nebaliae]|nr:hypothetical protein SNEBB_009786 [Seison nebaliae]
MLARNTSYNNADKRTNPKFPPNFHLHKGGFLRITDKCYLDSKNITILPGMLNYCFGSTFKTEFHKISITRTKKVKITKREYRGRSHFKEMNFNNINYTEYFEFTYFYQAKLSTIPKSFWTFLNKNNSDIPLSNITDCLYSYYKPKEKNIGGCGLKILF